MGEEINQTKFDLESEAEFLKRLRHETRLLKSWFDDRAFAVKETRMNKNANSFLLFFSQGRILVPS